MKLGKKIRVFRIRRKGKTEEEERRGREGTRRKKKNEMVVFCINLGYGGVRVI